MIECLHDVVDEVRRREVHRGEIGGEPERKSQLGAPPLDLCGRSPQHEGVQDDDGPGALSGGDELIGEDGPTAGIVPASKGFEPDDLLVVQSIERLVVHLHVAALHRLHQTRRRQRVLHGRPQGLVLPTRQPGQEQGDQHEDGQSEQPVGKLLRLAGRDVRRKGRPGQESRRQGRRNDHRPGQAYGGQDDRQVEQVW